MNTVLLCKSLQTAGVGAVGQMIFDNDMPGTIKRGVLVRLPMQGIEINHYMPGYFRNKVQVITRDTNVAGAQSLMAQVTAALSTDGPIDFLDDQGNFAMRINRMKPHTLPITYPRSDANLVECSVSFDTSYVLAQ